MQNPNLLYPMRVLRISEVCKRLGLCRSTVYELMSKTSTRRDPLFPKRLRLGKRAVGILEGELNAYLEIKAALAAKVAEEMGTAE